MRGFLNIRTLGLVTGVFLVSGMGESLRAQTVPQGYMTVTCPAGSVAMPSVTTFSVPLSGTVPSNFVGLSTGQIASVGINSISLAGTGTGAWSPGALSQAATPYFIRITSGVSCGQTFQISTTTANTASTVTVLNQGLDLTAAGQGILTTANSSTPDTFQIFPAQTLNSFFGTSTLGSTAAATADTVELFSGGLWNDYYYNTTSNIWQKGSVPADQGTVVLRPDSGVTFYRRGGTQLQFTVMGAAPTTNIQIVANNVGLTYLGNVFPVDQTLLTAAYNTIPNWVNNTGAVSSASTISFLNGGLYSPFNFSQSAGQWRKGSLPVGQNNVTIPAGMPIQLTQPASSASSSVFVITRALPYTLN